MGSEWAPRGIQINCIAPGIIYSDTAAAAYGIVLLEFRFSQLRFILAKLASFTIIYKPNIITTPHKIARTKCCSDRSRASSLSKTVFFGGVAPFYKTCQNLFVTFGRRFV